MNLSQIDLKEQVDQSVVSSRNLASDDDIDVNLVYLLVSLLGVVEVVHVLLFLQFCHDFAQLQKEFLNLLMIRPALPLGTSSERILKRQLGVLRLIHSDESLRNLQQNRLVLYFESNGLLQTLEGRVKPFTRLEHDKCHVTPHIRVVYIEYIRLHEHLLSVVEVAKVKAGNA